jgi:hypothetical protein
MVLDLVAILLKPELGILSPPEGRSSEASSWKMLSAAKGTPRSSQPDHAAKKARCSSGVDAPHDPNA